METKIKIIDIHAHCNSSSKFDCIESEIHKRSLNFLQSEYERLGISAGGLSYYSAVMSDEEIFLANEQLEKLSNENEKVYQWLVLDPRKPELFPQIRQKINGKKVLGIKIHSRSHMYDILEYGDKIFSFANELGCYVAMHPDKIENMVYFADKYPNMKLIIAHLGSLEHIEAVKSAKHQNVFTDTSGGASNLNNIVEYAVEQIGSEKIFFGTDNYSGAFQIGRVKFANISEEDKQNIFYKNAKKYFKKQFEKV